MRHTFFIFVYKKHAYNFLCISDSHLDEKVFAQECKRIIEIHNLLFIKRSKGKESANQKK